MRQPSRLSSDAAIVRAENSVELETTQTLDFSETNASFTLEESKDDSSRWIDAATAPGKAISETIAGAANSARYALFRRKYSLPIATVLQSLFAASTVIVVVASCSLFSSFISQERTNVADRLMEQLASCATLRFDRLWSRNRGVVADWEAAVADNPMTPAINGSVGLTALLSPAAALEVMWLAASAVPFEEWQLWNSTNFTSSVIRNGVVEASPLSLTCDSTAAFGIAWNTGSSSTSSQFVWSSFTNGATGQSGGWYLIAVFLTHATTEVWNQGNVSRCVAPLGNTSDAVVGRLSQMVQATTAFINNNSSSSNGTGWPWGTWCSLPAIGGVFQSSNASLSRDMGIDKWIACSYRIAPGWSGRAPVMADGSTVMDPAVWLSHADSMNASAASACFLSYPLIGDLTASPALRLQPSSSSSTLGYDPLGSWSPTLAPFSPDGKIVALGVTTLLLPSNSCSAVVPLATTTSSAATAAPPAGTQGIVLHRFAPTVASYSSNEADDLICAPRGTGVRSGTVEILWSGQVPLSGLSTTDTTHTIMNQSQIASAIASVSASGETYFTSTARSNVDGSVFATSSVSDAALDNGSVRNGVQLMVLISVVISGGIIAAGSFFFYYITRGIVSLAAAFAGIARFDASLLEMVDDLGPLGSAASPRRGGSGDGGLRQLLSSAWSAATRVTGRVRRGFRRSDNSSSSSQPSTIRIEGSKFVELQSVAVGLRRLAKHVQVLIRCVPAVLGGNQNVRDSVTTNSDDKSSLDASVASVASVAKVDDDFHGIDAGIPVHVRYESRSTGKLFAQASFRFNYHRFHHTLFQSLVMECLRACGEDPFQQVTLTLIARGNEQIALRDSAHVLDHVVSAAPTTPSQPKDRGSKSSEKRSESPSVRLIMQKSTTPKVTVQLTSFIDLVNFFSTVAFVVELVKANSGSAGPGLIAFCCMYSFALVVNFALCVVLVRQSIASDRRFSDWAHLRHTELSIGMFFSTLNLQNFEIMWTGIRLEIPTNVKQASDSEVTNGSSSNITGLEEGELQKHRTLLFFNAPPSDDIIFKSIQWSVVGFLFSDVCQFVFKMWTVVSAGSTVTASSLVTLVASSVSVIFNLAVKLHANFLWTRSAEQMLLARNSSSGNNTQAALEEAQRDSAKGVPQLSQRECSVIVLRALPPTDVHQLSLLAIEWNQFYDAVHSCTKRAKAQTLLTDAGLMVFAINAVNSSGRGAASACDDHEVDAVHFAFALHEAIRKQCTSVWRRCICITSGVYLTGVLGSFYKKSLQVVCPEVSGMRRLTWMGVQLDESASHGVTLISRSAALNAFGVDVRHAVVGQRVTTDEYREGDALQLMRPAILFASLRPSDSDTSRKECDREREASVVLHEDEVVFDWQEFALLCLGNETIPMMQDSRPRFLSAALGFHEFHLEDVRSRLSALLNNKQWLAEIPYRPPSPIAVTAQPRRMPKDNDDVPGNSSTKVTTPRKLQPPPAAVPARVVASPTKFLKL